VAVGERCISADKIIIATGGRPKVPKLPGAELGITSDGFFELEDLPRRVAVAGAGYIAVELAGMLNALGAEVTLFFRYGSVLRDFDDMIQRGLLDALEHDGIRCWSGASEPQLQRLDNGIHVRMATGAEEGPFDTWLWAIGRVPETENLGLELAGVETDDNGFIPTDKYQATKVPGIFAIGDVTGRVALTPVAIAAGRRLSDRLFGGMQGRHLDYDNVPSVVFSHPPIGSCGMTEQAAREEYGDDIQVYTSEFVPLLNGVTAHKPKTRMKLVTRGAEQKVIGIHLIGPGSDEMLQGFAVAMRMGARKQDFDDTVAIHPTSAEELVTMR
jgi:glutathione reductase (NADPH)